MYLEVGRSLLSRLWQWPWVTWEISRLWQGYCLPGCSDAHIVYLQTPRTRCNDHSILALQVFPVPCS